MMTRRKFLTLGALTLPIAAAGAQASAGTTALRVTRLTLRETGAIRFVQFSDLHHKGDTRFALRVVEEINRLEPEFVVFTGDLVEDKRYAPEALDFIRMMEAPVYGAPGNHDYRCGAPFADYERAFAATGGAWLVDRSLVLSEHDREIVGMGIVGIHALQSPQASRRLLLLHYPEMAASLGRQTFELILSGHSHGGQVRVPFFGAPFLPWGVGPYDQGYFETAGGPLYVNVGIGTYHFPLRLTAAPRSPS